MPSRDDHLANDAGRHPELNMVPMDADFCRRLHGMQREVGAKSPIPGSKWNSVPAWRWELDAVDSEAIRKFVKANGMELDRAVFRGLPIVLDAAETKLVKLQK